MQIGLARFGSATAVSGLRAIVQNLTDEGLVRISDNGRLEPRLAQGFSVAADGLSIRVQLRPGVTFHDGSPVSADIVATILKESLPGVMGSAFGDVAHITPTGNDLVEIGFKRASRLLHEALEMSIHKPDSPTIGTGPFLQTGIESASELRANRNYYLGQPAIDRITFTNYPTVRAAWAEMLRKKVDLLYEVSVDARDFMQGAKDVSVFSFTRPYQYLVVLNVRSSKLHSASLRRALNLAIDPAAVVRDAFDGHALVSSGPVWPSHWSFNAAFPRVSYDPQAAERSLAIAAAKSPDKQFHFTCLVPPDYERLAMVVKRQLEAVGVVMDLKEATTDEAVQALGTKTFEAVLLDLNSGPGLFRAYQVWHSKGSRNIGALGSPEMDVALNRIRYATSDDEYRKAVAGFQQFAIDDPPAIFLAWGERARAVSRRFTVAAEPGRDILTTLRLWRPAAAGERTAGRN